jgi:hypothetical protein
MTETNNQGETSMSDSAAYSQFIDHLQVQTFMPRADEEPYYLPKPKTDEERAAIIRIVEEERRRDGSTVTLLEAADFEEFFARRMEPIIKIMDEEIAAINWPIRRRVTELRPADIISTGGRTATRGHVSYVEPPCERDGCQQVKVTFCDGQVRYVPADAEETVYRPGSI